MLVASYPKFLKFFSSKVSFRMPKVVDYSCTVSDIIWLTLSINILIQTYHDKTQCLHA